MKKGTLYLVPTPICDDIDLHHQTKSFLQQKVEDASVIAVEEAKPCRRRWLAWGLPRESIANFEIYNEHNRDSQKGEFIQKLNQGIDVCLMSDCGLPAFCDPGQELVKLAHENNIKVTSTAFDNSIVLALALSGFPHSQFHFVGFLPRDKEQRSLVWEKIEKQSIVTILMDTPYRLSRVLDEVDQASAARSWNICLATQLGYTDEEVLVGSISKLRKRFEGQKREFIMIIEPSSGKKV